MFLQNSNQSNGSLGLSDLLSSFKDFFNSLSGKGHLDNNRLQEKLVFFSNHLPHKLKNLIEKITSLVQNPNFREEQKEELIDQILYYNSRMLLPKLDKRLAEFLNNYESTSVDDKLNAIISFLGEQLKKTLHESVRQDVQNRISCIQKEQEYVTTFMDQYRTELATVSQNFAEQLFKCFGVDMSLVSSENIDSTAYIRVDEQVRKAVSKFLGDQFSLTNSINYDEEIRTIEAEIKDLGQRRQELCDENLKRELSSEYFTVKEQTTNPLNYSQIREVQNNLNIKMNALSKLKIKKEINDIQSIMDILLKKDPLPGRQMNSFIGLCKELHVLKHLIDDSKFVTNLLPVLNKMSEALIERNLLTKLHNIFDYATFFSLDDATENVYNIEKIINAGICGTITYNHDLANASLDALRPLILKHTWHKIFEKMLDWKGSYAEEFNLSNENQDLSESQIKVPSDEQSKQIEMSSDVPIDEELAKITLDELEERSRIELEFGYHLATHALSKTLNRDKINAASEQMHSSISSSSASLQVIRNATGINARSTQDVLHQVGDMKEKDLDRSEQISVLAEDIIDFLVKVKENQVTEAEGYSYSKGTNEKIIALCNDLSHQLGNIRSGREQSFF